MTTSTMLQNEDVPGVDCPPSSYLKYLPAIYSEDEFIGRFLNIFENILTPIGQTIDQGHLYLDPMVAPEALLPWLASWVNLVLDEQWPIERRRQLIGAAVELYQLRGTPRGLSRYLEIYIGTRPTIVEHHGGIRLGAASELGYNTVLGEGMDHCFTVIIELESSSSTNVKKVRDIIEAEKPTHAAYRLEIVKKGEGQAEKS